MRNYMVEVNEELGSYGHCSMWPDEMVHVEESFGIGYSVAQAARYIMCARDALENEDG